MCAVHRVGWGTQAAGTRAMTPIGHAQPQKRCWQSLAPQRVPHGQALEQLAHRHGGADSAGSARLFHQLAVGVIAARARARPVLRQGQQVCDHVRAPPTPHPHHPHVARAALPRTHLSRTPTSCSAVRVTTLTSATAHSELSASPRKPNVASSCRSSNSLSFDVWYLSVSAW